MRASDNVFGTFELLEAILYELPPRTLLLSQRVSQQSKAVISNSTKLQQALFFQPIPALPVAFYELSDLHHGSHSEWERARSLTARKCLRNPLLIDVVEVLEDVCSSLDSYVWYTEHTPLEDAIRDYLQSKSKTAVPSWAKMLPWQPIVESPIYITCYYTDEDSNECEYRVRCFQATTMLEILKELDVKIREYDKVADLEVELCFSAPFQLAGNLEDYRQLDAYAQPWINRDSKKRKSGNLLSWVRRTRMKAP